MTLMKTLLTFFLYQATSQNKTRLRFLVLFANLKDLFNNCGVRECEAVHNLEYFSNVGSSKVYGTFSSERMSSGTHHHVTWSIVIKALI